MLVDLIDAYDADEEAEKEKEAETDTAWSHLRSWTAYLVAKYPTSTKYNVINNELFIAGVNFFYGGDRVYGFKLTVSCPPAKQIFILKYIKTGWELYDSTGKVLKDSFIIDDEKSFEDFLERRINEIHSLLEIGSA